MIQNNASQCFALCQFGNNYIYPIYYNSSAKLIAYCACKLGDIYATISLQICPRVIPQCSSNCIKYCEIPDDNTKCFFNCANKPFVIPGIKSNSQLSCTCQTDFVQINSNCKGKNN